MSKNELIQFLWHCADEEMNKTRKAQPKFRKELLDGAEELVTLAALVQSHSSVDRLGMRKAA